MESGRPVIGHIIGPYTFLFLPEEAPPRYQVLHSKGSAAVTPPAHCSESGDTFLVVVDCIFISCSDLHIICGLEKSLLFYGIRLN